MEDKKKGKPVTKLKFIITGVVGLVCIVFAGLLCISGIFVKPVYLKPWQKDYGKSFKDPRIGIAAYGLLAANGHNMQPWKIKLDKSDNSVFYLYADSARITGEVDPFARQMMVSQGTFLEDAAIGGAYSGYITKMELYPEGNYDETDLPGSMDRVPVAKITLAKADPDGGKLFDTIFLPDTNRSAYQDIPLSQEEINRLKGINEDPDLTLEIYKDAESIEKLGNIAMEGIRIEAGVDRVMEESDVIFRSNEYEKNKYRFGFSVEGQGTDGIIKHLLQGLVTVFPALNQGKAASDTFMKSGKTSVDHTPAYILIKSKDNSRVNQVKSGMLYSRLIAAAHTLGLVMQPLSQPLEEYPEMKEVYDEIHRDYAPEGGTIQMLIRIGRPTQEAPLSMRQDVMDIITEQ